MEGNGGDGSEGMCRDGVSGRSGRKGVREERVEESSVEKRDVRRSKI
jgi:hypothetical protein